MYLVIISPKARKRIKEMSKRHQKVIGEIVKELQEDSLLMGKPLSRNLTGKFSFKVGVYRIIYIINEKDRIVNFLSAGHRATVYD